MGMVQIQLLSVDANLNREGSYIRVGEFEDSQPPLFHAGLHVQLDVIGLDRLTFFERVLVKLSHLDIHQVRVFRCGGGILYL